MSQSKYVSKIEPSHMNASRRTCLTDEMTSEERYAFRAFMGNLHYASINTRPRGQISRADSAIFKVRSTRPLSCTSWSQTIQRHMHPDPTDPNQGSKIFVILERIIRVCQESRKSHRYDNLGYPQRHKWKLLMSNKPFVMGISQDSESGHQHFVSRNDFTPDKTRSTIMDEIILGMDSNPQVDWKRLHEIFKREPQPI